MAIIRDSNGKFLKNIFIEKKCVDCGKDISYKATRCKRCAIRGINNWAYGLTKDSNSSLKRISEKQKVNQKGENNSMFNHVYSNKTIEKLSKNMKDRFENGYKTWNEGKEMPFETRLKSSLTQRKINIDEWKGFSKYEEYPKEFFNNRDLIINRDGYKCRLCGRNNCKLDIHHIDHNKNNNNPNNLITLCHSCHANEPKNRTIIGDKLKKILKL